MTIPLILVSNDDGIEAAGLRALTSALDGLGEVWVVAPSSERSTSSHALTLREPVPVKEVGERQFAVDGWPADCVYLGLYALLPRRPDVVVSGINAGPNLGTDVLYSGTVGAAREAFTRDVPSLAMSLTRGEDYTLAGRFGRLMTRALLERRGRPMLLNVNVPGVEARGVRVARLGRRIYPIKGEPSGERDGWTLYQIGGGLLGDELLPGSDGEAIEQGFVSLTPLAIDSTADDQIDEVRALGEVLWSKLS